MNQLYKIILIITTLLISINLTLFSQDSLLKTSKEYTLNPKSSTILVKGSGNDFYILKKNGSLLKKGITLEIVKFDQNLTEIDTSSIEIYTTEPSEYYLDQVVFSSKNGNRIFFNQINSKRRVDYFIVNSISDNGKLINDIRIIDSVSYPPKTLFSKFIMRFSSDSSKIIIAHSEKKYEDLAYNYKFKVYDYNLNLLWEKSVVIPSIDWSLDINEICLSNSGVIYFKTIESMKYSNGVLPPPKIHIIRKEDVGLKTIELDTKYRYGALGIKTNDANELICVGMYSDSNQYPFLKGTMHFKISSDDQIYNLNYIPFNTKILEKKYGNKTKKYAKGLPYFGNVKIDMNSIGDYIVSSFTDFNYSATDGNGPFNYLSSDIYVQYINKDLIFKWDYLIRLDQWTTNDKGLYNSYSIQSFDNNIKILYNDHPNNFNGDPNKSEKRMNIAINSELILETIDYKGNVIKKKLHSNQSNRNIARPKGAIRLNDNSLVFLGSNYSPILPTFYKLYKLSQ